MSFLEKDLEDLLLEANDELLDERGLTTELGLNKLNQVYLGNYGTCDMIGWSRGSVDSPDKIYQWVDITVVELKKDYINIDSILQVIRYVKGVEEYLKSRKFKYNIKAVLIGKRIETTSNACYLFDYLDILDVYTYEYKIDGIHFEKEDNYKLTDNGFNSKLNGEA